MVTTLNFLHLNACSDCSGRYRERTGLFEVICLDPSHGNQAIQVESYPSNATKGIRSGNDVNGSKPSNIDGKGSSESLSHRHNHNTYPRTAPTPRAQRSTQAEEHNS